MKSSTRQRTRQQTLAEDVIRIAKLEKSI